MAEPNLPTAANPKVHGLLGKVAAESGFDAAESIAALHSSVAGQLLKPARYDGVGGSVDELIQVVCELAVVNSSLAWLTAMFNAAADQVKQFGRRWPMSCGTPIPMRLSQPATSAKVTSPRAR